MIEFSNVGLRYGQGPEILRDLTFRIEPGSFHFLTGPSGSGKTSLLKLLLLSLKPTRGRVTLFGKDTSKLNQDELLGLRLLSLHNLRFVIDLARGAREAIERGDFGSYKRDALERLQ